VSWACEFGQCPARFRSTGKRCGKTVDVTLAVPQRVAYRWELCTCSRRLHSLSHSLESSVSRWDRGAAMTRPVLLHSSTVPITITS